MRGESPVSGFRLGKNKNWPAQCLDINMITIVKFIKRFVKNQLRQIKYEWVDAKRWRRQLAHHSTLYHYTPYSNRTHIVRTSSSELRRSRTLAAPFSYAEPKSGNGCTDSVSAKQVAHTYLPGGLFSGICCAGTQSPADVFYLVVEDEQVCENDRPQCRECKVKIEHLTTSFNR